MIVPRRNVGDFPRADSRGGKAAIELSNRYHYICSMRGPSTSLVYPPSSRICLDREGLAKRPPLFFQFKWASELATERAERSNTVVLIFFDTVCRVVRVIRRRVIRTFVTCKQRELRDAA